MEVGTMANWESFVLLVALSGFRNTVTITSGFGWTEIGVVGNAVKEGVMT